ncbi:response regulator [Maritalea sp.]|uniref:response regulator n=1 Tax=Maritalea sp. TaxID=2003361 RepID=UPI003EFB38F8
MRNLKVIGIIAQNRALSSILSMVLRDCEDVRIRVFESQAALKSYLRIAPIHLLICDYQLANLSCPVLIAALKCNPQMHTENMQVIALTQGIDRKMQKAIGAAGIDEIIVKPMSPAYIRERADARLMLPTKYKRVPKQTEQKSFRSTYNVQQVDTDLPWADNVIPLFGNRQMTPSPELS